MLNTDNNSCDIYNMPTLARSEWAEKMSATHKSVRCGTHSLYHLWEEMSSDERRDFAIRRQTVRFDAYVEVMPGKWALRDINPTKKKKSKASDEDD